MICKALKYGFLLQGRSFSTTPQNKYILRQILDVASQLRKRYLIKRGFEFVGTEVHKDGVPIDSEFTRLTVETAPFWFKVERIWAAAMFPLIPGAYFLPSTTAMDVALTIMIVLHNYWGMSTVVKDYARPYLIGDVAAEIAPRFVTLFSIILFCGLMHFNYMDVGLTRAFEMFFSL